MTKFEIDDNYITENIPIDAMTNDELLKKRDYIYGTYRNKNYLNFEADLRIGTYCRFLFPTKQIFLIAMSFFLS